VILSCSTICYQTINLLTGLLGLQRLPSPVCSLDILWALDAGDIAALTLLCLFTAFKTGPCHPISAQYIWSDWHHIVVVLFLSDPDVDRKSVIMASSDVNVDFFVNPDSGYRILKSDTHPDIGSWFRHNRPTLAQLLA